MPHPPQDPYRTPHEPTRQIRSSFRFALRWAAIFLLITAALPLSLCVYCVASPWELVGFDAPKIVFGRIGAIGGEGFSIAFTSRIAAAVCGLVGGLLIAVAFLCMLLSRRHEKPSQHRQ